MTASIVPVNILLVEDNEGDIVLIKEALANSKVANELTIKHDGESAVEYLQSTSSRSETLPHLILLDLNLPKKTGQEVLEELKSDENLKAIPVVIMTSSSDEQDILKSYNLHANAFITKPLDFSQLIKVVGVLDDFWLSVVKLPGMKGGS